MGFLDNFKIFKKTAKEGFKEGIDKAFDGVRPNSKKIETATKPTVNILQKGKTYSYAHFQKIYAWLLEWNEKTREKTGNAPVTPDIFEHYQTLLKQKDSPIFLSEFENLELTRYAKEITKLMLMPESETKKEQPKQTEAPETKTYDWNDYRKILKAVWEKNQEVKNLTGTPAISFEKLKEEYLPLLENTKDSKTPITLTLTQNQELKDLLIKQNEILKKTAKITAEEKLSNQIENPKNLTIDDKSIVKEDLSANETTTVQKEKTEVEKGIIKTIQEKLTSITTENAPEIPKAKPYTLEELKKCFSVKEDLSTLSERLKLTDPEIIKKVIKENPPNTGTRYQSLISTIVAVTFPKDPTILQTFVESNHKDLGYFWYASCGIEPNMEKAGNKTLEGNFKDYSVAKQIFIDYLEKNLTQTLKFDDKCFNDELMDITEGFATFTSLLSFIIFFDDEETTLKLLPIVKNHKHWDNARKTVNQKLQDSTEDEKKFIATYEINFDKLFTSPIPPNLILDQTKEEFKKEKPEFENYPVSCFIRSKSYKFYNFMRYLDQKLIRENLIKEENSEPTSDAYKAYLKHIIKRDELKNQAETMENEITELEESNRKNLEQIEWWNKVKTHRTLKQKEEKNLELWTLNSAEIIKKIEDLQNKVKEIHEELNKIDQPDSSPDKTVKSINSNNATDAAPEKTLSPNR